MTLKAVYFDLGGVLVRTEFQSPRERLAERVGMTYEELVTIVFESKSSREASIGRISEDEHWKNVARALHRPLKERENLHKEFFDGDIIDRELIAFIRSLRPRYKTGLISNAWDGLRPYIGREKFADAFDALTISAEVGVMKPDPAIFQHALDQLGVKPKEAVFVDDFAENITGCEAIGMRGIRFRSAEQAMKDLKKLLADSHK
jgi:epoxide hydrolase-like predicted phosphatase